MHNRSRFRDGQGLDFILEIATRPWTPRSATIGGVRWSAAGVPASYVVREDEILAVPLRFTEAEWPSVREMLRWGQGSNVIQWTPDAEHDPFVSIDVLLWSPHAGEDIAPARGEFVGTYELTVELRRADGATWDLDYFRVP